MYIKIRIQWTYTERITILNMFTYSVPSSVTNHQHLKLIACVPGVEILLTDVKMQ